ncbi:fumarylacetoacetate hydrolase family protein [Gorillibacterium timonense]|uniref:fumarylacetoacetate hydrolase family protein n=1 Tax=Gorillibacterium timonense TaxID=1689269 RepID=UPI00071E19CA|nr:fumarylacetoacetate hydrolase family protein [Gorillibacterium timonense]
MENGFDQSIQNLYCVGRNYRLHAEELGNAVPTEPMLFLKPSHAVIPADGRVIELPGDRGELHYEAEVVLRIGRRFERGMSVDELADGFALGIDFTLRDVQSTLKAKGQPWLPAKGFLRSAPIGVFRPFPGAEAAADIPFSLEKNGHIVQSGQIRDMIFSLQQIVDFTGERYGLGPGDLIFTGTPAGVGKADEGDRFELKWNGEIAGSFVVRLTHASEDSRA